MQRHIALIEDDEVISNNYAEFLADVGFVVDTYLSKPAALQGLAGRLPDLVLLDITLNRERDAGFAICADLRRRSPTLPIIFLTSHDEEIDRVSGFRLGADDYITKDVSFDYLVIRIEALFRRLDAYRASAASAPAPETAATPAAEGPNHSAFLDARASVATWQSRRLDLTLTQFWILQALCERPGLVRSSGELMQAARLVVEPNTIAAHIKAIRGAFLQVDPGFDRIRTERGRGYRWVPD